MNFSQEHGAQSANGSQNATFKLIALSSEPAGIVIKMVAYCIMLAISLLGNTLVLMILYKNTSNQPRTPSNVFIANMACADILVTLSNVTMQIKYLVQGHEWLVGGELGIVLCKLYHFIWPLSIVVSTQSMSCIAADRFFLVFLPLKRVITPRVCRALIATTWIVAGALSSPLPFRATFRNVSSGRYCSLSFVNGSHWFTNYFIYLLSTCVAAPLFAILIIYTTIAVKLYSRKTPGHRLAHSQRRRNAINRRNVLMFVTIVGVFSLCWIPLLSSFLACYTTFPNICRSPAFYFTIWYFAFANSALNPVIYFLFSSNFRRRARTIFSCCRDVSVLCPWYGTISPFPSHSLPRALPNTAAAMIMQPLDFNIKKSK